MQLWFDQVLSTFEMKAQILNRLKGKFKRITFVTFNLGLLRHYRRYIRSKYKKKVISLKKFTLTNWDIWHTCNAVMVIGNLILSKILQLKGKSLIKAVLKPWFSFTTYQPWFSFLLTLAYFVLTLTSTSILSLVLFLKGRLTRKMKKTCF